MILIYSAFFHYQMKTACAAFYLCLILSVCIVVAMANEPQPHWLMTNEGDDQPTPTDDRPFCTLLFFMQYIVISPNTADLHTSSFTYAFCKSVHGPQLCPWACSQNFAKAQIG